MAEPIRITIPGRPVPKERPAVTGRYVRVYTPPRTRAYQEQVAAAALEQGCKPLTGPVSMRLVFYLCDDRQGDLSNMIKSVEDGLNGIAYDDDAQVKHIVAYVRRAKRRRDERAEVEIAPLSNEEVETA
ncbi:MAG: RusA family crossover junction endodeoxyribonuclease [Firmicutes bacterium]|nr:RusA family crossover junction endodeoxyribonuclease [Bacillota bacterium]